ncbi:H17B6 dehydrogenase, partial [Rhinoptilus africanus]|nr:H17B6 dehydrogenase [Rhinoptilus africanus]
GYFRTRITSVDSIERNFRSIWEKLPAETKASYGQNYFEGFLSTLRKMEKRCSPNLRLVTDCMEHALTSRHPRARYSAGWDAKLLYIPLSYLPSALTDLL